MPMKCDNQSAGQEVPRGTQHAASHFTQWLTHPGAPPAASSTTPPATSLRLDGAIAAAARLPQRRASPQRKVRVRRQKRKDSPSAEGLTCSPFVTPVPATCLASPAISSTLDFDLAPHQQLKRACVAPRDSKANLKRTLSSPRGHGPVINSPLFPPSQVGSTELPDAILPETSDRTAATTFPAVDASPWNPRKTWTAAAPALAPPRLTVSTYRAGGTGTSQMLAVTPYCPVELAVKRRWSLSDFQLTQELGEGMASRIFRARVLPGGLPVALKIYFKESLTTYQRTQVRKEIKLHSQLHHPNVIQLYGAFEDKQRFYLAMELASQGDLFDELKLRRGSWTEGDVVRRFIQPLLVGVDYLHSLGLIHRDIKLENTFVMEDGTIKVGDFGHACNTASEYPIASTGTLEYMCPEMFNIARYGSPGSVATGAPPTTCAYDNRVDSWSCGVLVCELLTAARPFARGTAEATKYAIRHTEPVLHGHMSRLAEQFVSAALTKSAAHRPSVQQLLKHDWIQTKMVPNSTRRLFVGEQLPSGPCNMLRLDHRFAAATGPNAAATDAAYHLLHGLHPNPKPLFQSALSPPTIKATALGNRARPWQGGNGSRALALDAAPLPPCAASDDDSSQQLLRAYLSPASIALDREVHAFVGSMTSSSVDTPDDQLSYQLDQLVKANSTTSLDDAL